MFAEKMRLDRKVAIITGAAQGIGKAIARLFVKEGARVVLLDVSPAGQAVAHSLGDAAMFRPHDVSEEAQWIAAVAETVERWGAVNILVNNAAINKSAALVDCAVEDFEQVMRVNLLGPMLGMKTVAPAMIQQGHGSIVNIVAAAAMMGVNGISSYIASKWGLRGLSKTAAMELGPHGIRVNSIFPGAVNTSQGNFAGRAPAEFDALFWDQPIPRAGEPIEIAYASLFLASDESTFFSGAELAVDGGQTVGLYRSFLPATPTRPAEVSETS